MKVLSFLLIIMCFAACKKNPPIESVLVSSTRDSLTYQPKEPGAKWSYSQNVQGVVTPYVFLRLSTDSIFYGSVYNMFSSQVANPIQYIRQDGSKYYSLFFPSTNIPKEQLVLDTIKNVGESWIGLVNGNDVYTYTMKRKILSDTAINGISFKKMLVVHLERTTAGSSTISGDTYYARGVGQVLTTGIVSGLSVEIKLIKYE
jgi:hypothetical protein